MFVRRAKIPRLRAFGPALGTVGQEKKMKVKNKVCVVTGAAGGIGEAIARRYAKEGAKGVVVADLDSGRLQSVANDINGLAVACDAAQEADVRHLIAEAEKRYGWRCWTPTRKSRCRSSPLSLWGVGQAAAGCSPLPAR